MSLCQTALQLLVLRSESPNGMCANLRTVAASNNRVHMPQSLYYCLFMAHKYIVVLRAHPVRGESHNQRNANGEVGKYPLLFTKNHTNRTLFL